MISSLISSANSSVSGFISSNKSFMTIKNKKAPKTDPDENHKVYSAFLNNYYQFLLS